MVLKAQFRPRDKPQEKALRSQLIAPLFDIVQKTHLEQNMVANVIANAILLIRN